MAAERSAGRTFVLAGIAFVALVQLLHGLLWVFAMFLADSIWGDRTAQWMVMPAVVAPAALLCVQPARARVFSD